MDHSADLTGPAIVALAALMCGMLFVRLKQPPIAGYILAGVLLGPTALGFVANQDSIEVLAHLGVLLLLFVVGMELSVRVFIVMWRLVLKVVALQVAGSLLAVLLCTVLLNLPIKLAILLGFVISLSSTAVAIKMLEQIGETRSRVGRTTVAILIGQDLAFLPMLLFVESIGEGGFGFGSLFRVFLAVALLALVLTVLGKRQRGNLPFAAMITGHADLSPLTGLVYCFGIGAVFGILGLSAAYGAFIAGLLIGRSHQRELLSSVMVPIESVLVMVFFLSIGLLIDLRFILDNLGTVLVLLALVVLFKTVLNVAIMRLMGEPWPRAVMEGTLLAQIGEFSFLLAASGLSAGAIDLPGSRLVIAVTVLSIALSPFWLATARRVHNVAARHGRSLDDLMSAAFRSEIFTYRRTRRAVERRVRSSIRRRRAAAPDAQAEPLALEPPPPPEAADVATTTEPSGEPPLPEPEEERPSSAMPGEPVAPPSPAEPEEERPASGSAESREEPEADEAQWTSVREELADLDERTSADEPEEPEAPQDRPKPAEGNA